MVVTFGDNNKIKLSNQNKKEIKEKKKKIRNYRNAKP